MKKKIKTRLSLEKKVFILDCNRNHMITTTNRPISGAGPGICGSEGTHFDSENTISFVITLATK